ncbi:MAG: hypothetical protein KIT31_02185 [Deltaproteobacteria bacterium]|nr:hypothetical protein [Deltaproteobacteria bacterium]
MRIAADLRGTSVALVQPGCVLVLDVPSLEPKTELGIPGDSDDTDVAFIDATGRLAVLGRAPTSTTLHVVDPIGPTILGKLDLRAGARMPAVSGDHALVIAGTTVSVVDATAADVTATAIPVRGQVTVAAGVGNSQFLLAVGGALEEWDARTRTPGRRLRLDQPLDPVFVGGNARHLWTIPRRQADAIDVIVLASRTSRRIELGEPALRVDAHADGALLAVLGAETRTAYVVDLTRGTVERIAEHVADVAWIGRGATLAIKPTDGALELRALGEPAKAVSAPAPAPARPAAPPPKLTRDGLSDRLAAWRAKHTKPRDAAPSPVASAEAGWRTELATAARAVLAAGETRELPEVELIATAARRLELPEGLHRAFALLYGAHLAGHRTSPAELARALHDDWTEALGAGGLAAAGALRIREGRVGLHREVLAFLDERPPLTGTVFGGDDGATSSAVALVAPPSIEARRLGAWAASIAGAVLVPDGAPVPWRRLAREARLRGVAPLVIWASAAAVLAAPPAVAAVVVERPAVADELGLSVLATWRD